MEKLFYYNKEQYQMERIEREQTYKGHTIQTLTTYYPGDPKRRHREYRIFFPDGHVSDFRINKRGGNIKDLKWWIDTREKSQNTTAHIDTISRQTAIC